MIQIKNRKTGAVLHTVDADTLRGAYLYGADLTGADLRVADLRGADLYGAYLSGADLYGANMRDANLSGANLRDAILYGVNLYGADLYDADLYGAKLTGPNLNDIDLTGAILPDGRTLPEYIAWLPEGLLTQGGKPLAEVAAAWGKVHSWSECPMSVAFGVGRLEDVPECWRSAAATFVALFDGDHLPKPEVQS